MSKHAGPIRNGHGLATALKEICAVKDALGGAPPLPQCGFDTVRLDWFDLRNMLLVADSVVASALKREESRGAHQREDFPATSARWAVNQTMRVESGEIVLQTVPCAGGAERYVAE
jgi:succinate dehydrogenase / fumarate reductase flavoprotein subunit/fumarate reductase (CoM/CoB) subunit A